jgi:hypothetical protein
MSSCPGSSPVTCLATTFGPFNRNLGLASNGALLVSAEAAGFSVLVTGDQNLEHQQNLTERGLGVVVLCAESNALEDLLPLVPAALVAIERVQQGQVIRVAR